MLEHQRILEGKDIPRFNPNAYEMRLIDFIKNNGQLDYAPARGWEQALMEHYGTKTGIFPENMKASFDHNRILNPDDYRAKAFEKEYSNANKQLKGCKC